MVNAAIGISWSSGITLIATEFLPVSLKGCKEVLEEINEGATFGNGFVTSSVVIISRPVKKTPF